MYMVKKNTMHYAWWVLIMCCAIQAGSQGTIFDTCGVFNSPVCEEYGFEVGAFTMAQTFGAIAMMVTQPFTTLMYRRFDMKNVLLFSGAVYYLSHLSMSMANEIWHWYVLMIIQGIAGGFFYRISYTILICRWFSAKTATALAIATAVGSVMGMLMNPVAAFVIEKLGWRFCYVFLAVVGAVITLPIICAVMRGDHSDVQPYTGQKTTEQKDTFIGRHKGKQAGLVSFLLISGASVCYFCGGYYPHLFNYCVSIGMGLTAGSLMTSFELGGTMAIKLFIGPLYDRIGFFKTTFVLFVLSVVGYAGYFIFSGPALYLTTALCGIYCATTAMVLVPLFAREQVGEDRFVRILPWMTTIGGAISSLSNTLYGYLFDYTGNYEFMFIICIVSIVISFAMLVIVNNIKPNAASSLDL